MGPPDGEHDDTIASLALAIMGAVRDTSIVDLSSYSPDRQIKTQKNLADREQMRSNSLLALPMSGVMPVTFFGSEYSLNYFGGKATHNWRDSTCDIRPPLGLTRPYQ